MSTRRSCWNGSSSIDFLSVRSFFRASLKKFPSDLRLPLSTSYIEFEIFLKILKGPFLISSSLFLFILFPLWVKTVSPILNSCSRLFLPYFCLLISKFLAEFLNASSLSLFKFILFSVIPLGMISIIFPYSKWFGANPVTLCLVLLYSSTLSFAIFVQFLFFFSELILHLILFTNVWFTPSFSPLKDGQSVKVKINLMLIRLI